MPAGTPLLRAVLACFVAGAVAAACGAEAPPPEDPAGFEPQRVHVASLNAWAVPLLSSKRRERMDKLPGAVAALPVDVLCLQEVWSAGDQQRITAALVERLPHAAAGGGGLLLLSRFPVLRSTFVPFPAYAGLSLGERLARKGLLDVVLDTPAGPLRVLTSHLALAFGPRNPRSLQLRSLLDHAESRRDLPLVLAADLNTASVRNRQLTDEYRLLLDAGFTDANPPRILPDGEARRPPPTRIGWPRPEGQPLFGWSPDYILFRSGRTVVVRLETFRQALDERASALSDHNLLLATVRLEAAVTSPEEQAR